jgi:hypothetical protein
MAVASVHSHTAPRQSNSEQASAKGCLWAIGIGVAVVVLIGLLDNPKTPASNSYKPKPSYTETAKSPPAPVYTPPKNTPPINPQKDIPKISLPEPRQLTSPPPSPKEAESLSDWELGPDIWHSLSNSEGREISARVGSFDGTHVNLTTSSGAYTYPIYKLSESSRKLVRDLDRLRKRPKPQSLPLSGVLRGAVGQSNSTGPLTIKTRTGSGNYYVKLVEKHSGTTRMTIFIRSGETTSMAVPSGTYEMRYATGQTWYGEETLFGDSTSYNKADSDFTFSSGLGYTVELYLQQFGNLETESINKDNF